MSESAVVVVPVLGRPHRAQPFVDSLRETSDVRLVFICSMTDVEQKKACRATGEEVIIARWIPDKADFARKINLGYRRTSEDWIFCGADDLRFKPGWLEAALAEGRRTGLGVIGTQDEGNPFVRRGRHSTHPLVRRTYIEEYGGTFDNSGEIYSELYDHQWVDSELVTIAQNRKQWSFARRSYVEHMHPHWKKGEMDATYEKSGRCFDEDRELFRRRMQEFKAQRLSRR
jgi:hypothetical protein